MANADAMFYSCESHFQEKNPVDPTGKFLSLILPRNNVASQFYPLSTLLSVEFQIFSTGSDHLQEVAVNKRFQM